MKFDIEEYKNLVKYLDDLKNAKIEKTEPVYTQNGKKFRTYAIMISDNVHWQKRTQYLKLMKSFINFEINGIEFTKDFMDLHNLNEAMIKEIKYNYNQLKTVLFDSRAFGFSVLTSDLMINCDEFYSDLTPEYKASLIVAQDENDLRNSVSELFPEIQQYC